MRGEERAPADTTIRMKIMMIIPGKSCALCLRCPVRRQDDLLLRGRAADHEQKLLMELE